MAFLRAVTLAAALATSPVVAAGRDDCAPTGYCQWDGWVGLADVRAGTPGNYGGGLAFGRALFSNTMGYPFGTFHVGVEDGQRGYKYALAEIGALGALSARLGLGSYQNFDEGGGWQADVAVGVVSFLGYARFQGRAGKKPLAEVGLELLFPLYEH